MKGQNVCLLDDGTRIRFSFYTRDDEPYLYVRFRGPDNRRVARSTKASTAKAAQEEAVKIIRDEYRPKSHAKVWSWEEAVEGLKKEMANANRKARTIKDYEEKVAVLRKVFPHSHGPVDITPQRVKEFRDRRLQEGADSDTVWGNMNTLNCVWGRWFIKQMQVITLNPWEGVERPKLDEPQPRYIAADEQEQFFKWLAKRWSKWKLPTLFFRLIAATGRRISQIATLPTASLKPGCRVEFVAAQTGTKSRKVSFAKIAPELFRELQALAGPKYVFERYAEQLKAAYQARGGLRGAPGHAVRHGFTPDRVKWFMQDEMTEFNDQMEKKNPNWRRFTTHNFRDTRFTAAWTAKIDIDRASVALDCNPRTAKRHYVQMDRQAISDEVFDALNAPLPPKTQGEKAAETTREDE